jgi:hypothetical protein
MNRVWRLSRSTQLAVPLNKQHPVSRGHCGSLQGYDIRREAVEVTVAHSKAMTFVVKQ